MKVLFIGAGSMAEAIISGAVMSKVLNPLETYVTNRMNTERLSELTARYHVQVSYDTEALIQNCDVILLAVKPKDCYDILLKIKPFVQKSQLILSVLAGISISFINETLNKDVSIIRAMPNTSATLRQSATALSFNEKVSNEQRQWAFSLFNSIGTCVEVEENQLDLITALSGSGPAYVYYISEILEEAAIKLGLDSTIANSLITQTIIGAGGMLKESGLKAGTLRKNVTSEGGTTEAGIQALQEHNIKEAFNHCIEKATERAEQLRYQFQYK